MAFTPQSNSPEVAALELALHLSERVSGRAKSEQEALSQTLEAFLITYKAIRAGMLNGTDHDVAATMKEFQAELDKRFPTAKS